MTSRHGQHCYCHHCCMAKAAIHMERQRTEHTTKDHGSDRSQESGWHEAAHGFISGRAITFALGFGAREGEILLADGFVGTSRSDPFWQAGGHTYFGKNRGINSSQSDRGIELAPPLSRAERRRALQPISRAAQRRANQPKSAWRRFLGY